LYDGVDFFQIDWAGLGFYVKDFVKGNIGVSGQLMIFIGDDDAPDLTGSFINYADLSAHVSSPGYGRMN